MKVNSVMEGGVAYQWFSARLQYLQCVMDGDTVVLHWAIEMILAII